MQIYCGMVSSRHITLSLAVVCSVFTYSAGSLPSAEAAVFEERDTGKIVLLDAPGSHKGATSESGVLEGRDDDPSMPAEGAGEGVSFAPSGTAVILDAAPVKIEPVRLRRSDNLPKPRTFALPLSPQQERMRRLAISIGHRFARSPGVLRAKLDRQSFVALFTTMIHRESNFNFKAVSPAGAKGLGQLMPGTAKDLGVCDVFSPPDNLNGAATYLAMMLEQFGSPSMALAAYNAGPGAVTRHKGIPPFPETRQYVADILYGVDHVKPGTRSPFRNALAYDAEAPRNQDSPEPFDVLLSPNKQGTRCTGKHGANALADG